jgi:hypothetical protein
LKHALQQHQQQHQHQQQQQAGGGIGGIAIRTLTVLRAAVGHHHRHDSSSCLHILARVSLAGDEQRLYWLRLLPSSSPQASLPQAETQMTMSQQQSSPEDAAVWTLVHATWLDRFVTPQLGCMWRKMMWDMPPC